MRYLAFAHDQYYPQGGMYDCVGSFNALDPAIAVIEKYITEEANSPEWTYGHVYDLTTKTIIWSIGK